MEELAIIKDINTGIRDTNQAICWFTIEALSGSSLQIISIEQMVKLINESQCYKLSDLNNKPCIVTVKDRMMIFKKMKQLKPKPQITWKR